MLVETLTKYSDFIKLNVINYNYTSLKNRKPEFDQQLIQQMIYTKLPERIFYGLLRNYGKDVYIETDVYIEKSTEYEAIKLDEQVQRLLNIQSLYRGQQFQIKVSKLVPKGEEIGVELTDLLLGIIRHIITNASVDRPSKGLLEKNKLTIALLKNNGFLNFIRNIKYFEWNNTKELVEVDFRDYLKLFIAQNATDFF